MDRRTDGRKEGRKNERTDGGMDDGWLDGGMDCYGFTFLDRRFFSGFSSIHVNQHPLTPT